MTKGQGNIVQTFHERPTHIVINVESAGEVTQGRGLILQRNCDFCTGIRIEQIPELFTVCFADNSCHQALFSCVSTENISKLRCENDLEAIVTQCPDRVFTRGTSAKIRPSNQNATLAVRFAVQDELWVTTPCVEQCIIETCFGHALQENRGDDLVGVNI